MRLLDNVAVTTIEGSKLAIVGRRYVVKPAEISETAVVMLPDS